MQSVSSKPFLCRTPQSCKEVLQIQSKTYSPSALDNQLRTSMTPRKFSIEVVQKLTAAGYLAYWAGGCVRDLLRGKEPNDFDVATNATPQQVRQVFGDRKTLAVGESFGVIIVLGPQSAGQVEVATFRSEGEYSDGRRPDSVEFCTPEQDALRRDFTINGMFYEPLTSTIHDFVGGKQDLEKRIVRAIANPHDRMREDKLRMLRAVRFASVLDFNLDHTTAEAVRLMSQQITVVSAERISQELRKMLSDVHRARAVELAQQLELLPVILPEVIEHTFANKVLWTNTLETLKRLDVATFEIGMACLLRDVPVLNARRLKHIPESGTQRAVCRRLKLSNEETEEICWLVEHRNVFITLEHLPLCELKKLVVQPYFKSLEHLERTVAEVEGSSLSPFQYVEKFLESTPLEVIAPPDLLTGKDLIQAGYNPGPQFKEWLEKVRDAQLNEAIHSKEEAMLMVQEFRKLTS